MADLAPMAGTGEKRRFLTFRLDGDLYAVPASDVGEVIRAPVVARVPQAPKSLMGVANLRGAVLPIASVRGLLGKPDSIGLTTSRAIILRGEAPVGLMVDSVEALVSLDADRIETRQAELAARAGEMLEGAFQSDGAAEVARILDLRSLLARAFTPRARVSTAGLRAGSIADLRDTTDLIDDRRKLVTFDVAGQEFALDLDVVREVIPAPALVTGMVHGEALVLGVVGYRDTLLPLLALAGLLGLGDAGCDLERRKVVVIRVVGAVVGLVVDAMRAIISADPGLIEPTPAMLAARTGGEAQIAAIYRGDEGRRLVSILAPDRLFRENVMIRLGTLDGATPGVAEPLSARGDDVQFVVFRLGDDEFGLPIEVVDEVARVPDEITRLPKTPTFLEGVINLRGEVLPVIDQRKRFDMEQASSLPARRLIVVRTERHRAGLIVDSVSEVLRASTAAIEPAPDLTGEATRLVHGVINLEAAGRLVLLLDPTELLSRAERNLLDAFHDAEPAGA